MVPTSPYADITEKADRRWTYQLLERLSTPGLPVEELDDLVGALQAVSDPRSFAALEAVLCDTVEPPRTRAAAGSILRGMHHVAHDVPADKLRRWWLEGDAILRRHALMSMDGFHCPDIVLQEPPPRPTNYRLWLCSAWTSGSTSPSMRPSRSPPCPPPPPGLGKTAAYILLWDEPVAAKQTLDRGDRRPRPEVAAWAVNALKYYPFAPHSSAASLPSRITRPRRFANRRKGALPGNPVRDAGSPLLVERTRCREIAGLAPPGLAVA